jgi:antitoxin component of RelBE/YafQ-DinJ toxin-antitoxin module
MRPKQAMNLRIDDDLLAGLRRVRDEVGIPVSEQIRRAVREWLTRFDAPASTRTARRRAGTRKRA